jgi:hypothetical protein
MFFMHAKYENRVLVKSMLLMHDDTMQKITPTKINVRRSYERGHADHGWRVSVYVCW